MCAAADTTHTTAAGPPRSPAEAVALGKRLADEGHAVGWPTTTAATESTYGTSDPRAQPTLVEPAHLRGSDAFAVLDDEGRTHCVHRVRSNAEQCAVWFGAEVQEWLIHD